jgi:murein DD-endopeptidase MepM/ murein hydrolase activator NlpD
MKKYWKLRLNRLLCIVFLFLSGIQGVLSQNGGHKESFFFPVRPGEVNYLSGTMGEIRSTHFHTGIDIKTSGISGLPVYAAKDGYVSRIRVSAGGYGHALYIQHPGGETSVYGHLLQYRDDIADYVRKEQYNKESFEVNLFPEKDLFKVKRGEMVALSGNTGSSMGPHLHFEIRDEKQWPLNPLYFKFSEIKDDVAPIVQSFALKTFDINSRIGNQFGRYEYSVEKNGSGYSYGKPIPVYGNIGIQIYAYDRFNGASNKNGIPLIELYLDDTLRLKVDIETFSFNNSRDVINYYDFPVRNEKNRTYQKLYIDDGNQLPVYDFQLKKGILTIRDDKLHSIKVRMSDIAGNVSELTVPLKGEKPVSYVPGIEGNNNGEVSTKLMENYLVIRAGHEDKTPKNAFIYSNRMMYELIPAYFTDQQAVYLWDMRIGMPDSVSVCDQNKSFNFEIMIPSNTEFNFYNKVFDIRSFRKTLYDTVYLESNYTALEEDHLEIFTIGNKNIPLAGSMQINFKPKFDYTPSEKYAVYSTSDFKNYSFAGNQWKKGQITILTQNLGNFTILEDTIPPTIRPVQLNQQKVSFAIRDDLSGINKYEARLNGAWLLMHFDPKQDLIWSEMPEPNSRIKGELLLQVEDNAGNITEYKTQIN